MEYSPNLTYCYALFHRLTMAKCNRINWFVAYNKKVSLAAGKSIYIIKTLPY